MFTALAHQSLLMPKQDPFVQYAVKAFYHFTDRRNVASIRERGGLYSLASLRKMGIEIPAPGGNKWSHDADAAKGLDRYVHLCFRPKHPMEYRASQDGRIIDPVYLPIDPGIRQIGGVMFTADISNKSGVQIISLTEAL